MKNTHYHWLTLQSKPARSSLFLSIFLGIFSGVLMIAQSGLLAFIIDQVYLHHATRQALLDLFIFFSLD
jgi:ABC-type transport system involved in cytochrome bd biosynthesis, ATPase and permease components